MNNKKLQFIYNKYSSTLGTDKFVWVDKLKHSSFVQKDDDYFWLYFGNNNSYIAFGKKNVLINSNGNREVILYNEIKNYDCTKFFLEQKANKKDCLRSDAIMITDSKIIIITDLGFNMISKLASIIMKVKKIKF
jgi:hypothetical protein